MSSGSWWNLWVWLVGVVVRRYIDFLIYITYLSLLLLYLFLFAAVSLLFVHFFFYTKKGQQSQVFVVIQPYKD